MNFEQLLEKMDPDLKEPYAGLPLYSLDTYDDVVLKRKADQAVLDQAPSPLSNYPDIKATTRTITGGAGNDSLVLWIYEPVSREGKLPVVLYCHGGGCVAGSVKREEYYCLDIVSNHNCIVISVEYRLAPEYPAPAGQLDYYAAWMWLCKQGVNELNADMTRSVMFGPSGGGNVIIGTTLRLLDNHEQLPAYVMPLYPMLDDRNTTSSSREFTDARLWGRPQNIAAWRYYLCGLDEESHVEADYYIAPARRTDFTGFPQTFTFVGDLEPFRDEIIALVQHLVESGVSVDFTLYPGCFHSFDRFAPKSDVAKRAKRSIDEFFDRIFC